MRQNRSEQAVARLEEIVATHPDDAEAWNLLGALLDARGDTEGARRAFERALDADPWFPEALANTGLLALEAGQPERARAALDRLRAASPLGTSPEERALADALAGAGGAR